MSTPTLRWLQIHEYEQFEPVRIEFSPRENLILGLNGAGKTQLLRLIWAVLSLSLEELGERDLHISFELAAHSAVSEVSVVGEVRMKVALGVDEPPPEGPMRPTPGTLEVSLTLRGQGREFQFTRKGSAATLQDEEGRIVAKDHEHGSLSLAPHEYAWEWDDPDLSSMEAFEDLNPRRGCCSFGPTDFEFGVFSSETEFELRHHDRSSRPFVWLDVRKLGRSSPRLLWDLAPTARKIVSDLAGKMHAEGSEFEDLRLDASGLLAALNAVELRLRPDNRHESGSTVGYRGLRVRLKFSNGAEVPDSNLTFGQRRYVYAALVSSAHPHKPIVCDEIDNGMHPRLVLALLEMWSDRQVFVASHNKLVIDSTNFLSPADIREKIHIVRRRDDGRQVVKVFDEATASELHHNIEVGIQSPSDVLEAEGLW